MFRRLSPAEAGGAPVTFRFEGREVAARAGESVAAALLAVGEAVFRAAPVSGAPRGPFCMMGACFDCLVVIDGMPGCQACMTTVRPGMEVTRDRVAEGVQ